GVPRPGRHPAAAARDAPGREPGGLAPAARPAVGSGNHRVRHTPRRNPLARHRPPPPLAGVGHAGRGRSLLVRRPDELTAPDNRLWTRFPPWVSLARPFRTLPLCTLPARSPKDRSAAV